MRARPLALSRIARTLRVYSSYSPLSASLPPMLLSRFAVPAVYTYATHTAIPLIHPAASVAPLPPVATLVLPHPLSLAHLSCTRPADIPTSALPRRAGSAPHPRSVADQELAGPAPAFIGQPAAHAISCFLMPWPRSQGARVCSDYQTQPRPCRRAGVNHSMHACMCICICARTHVGRPAAVDQIPVLQMRPTDVCWALRHTHALLQMASRGHRDVAHVPASLVSRTKLKCNPLPRWGRHHLPPPTLNFAAQRSAAPEFLGFPAQACL